MSAANVPTFGMLLRRYRRAAGLTQEELAERAGLSPEGISALERVVNRAPRRDTVELLATALTLGNRDRHVLENAARRRPDASDTHAGSAGTPSQAHVAPLPLLGRAREVAVLDHHLAGEGPPVLVLAGEPGVGKTRLLQEAKRRGIEAGWTVLWSGCERRTGQMPYTPLLGALQRSLQSHSPTQRNTALQGCAWLVRLLPELTDTLGTPGMAWTLTAEQERRLTFEAVARYLSNIAGPAGTLLTLDDVQWADADAMDLLMTLVHATERVGVRVIAAYRDTEVRNDGPLASTLADLARDGLVQHIRLGPLGLEASRALATALQGDAAGDPAVIERMLRRTGGIPFFIVSYMQALRAGAMGEQAQDDVPWDAAQSIRQRVAALPQPARDILDLAAIAGPSAPLWLLLTATGTDGRDHEQIAAALESACHVRLLREDGDGGYRFAHEVIGDVIAADLGAARRAALHQRIADLLERSPGEAPVAQLAYHYARSGDVEKAIIYLELAGDQAEQMGAYTAAEDYYRRLSASLDGASKVLAAAAARGKLGRALCATGRFGEGVAVLVQAADTCRRMGESEQEAQITAQIGQACADQGTSQAGIARLSRFLDSSDSQRVSLRTLALLYDTLAQLHHIAGDYAAQLALAERAANLAEAAGDSHLLAQVRMRTGNALRMLGRLREASLMMEEVIASAEAAGDQMILASALENVSVVYLLRGEFDRASRYVERARTLAERSGDPLALQLMVMRKGLNEFATGDWISSRRDFEDAAAMTMRSGTSWVSAYTALGLGQLDLAQGEREHGLARLDESIRLAQGSGDLQALRWAHTALAEAELLDGDPEAARARLEPLLDRPGQQEGLVTYLMPYLAWAHMEMGELAEADTIVSACVNRATAENIRLALVDALRVRTLYALRTGNRKEAAQALGHALELAQQIGYPYGKAKLLYTRGMLESEGGDPNCAHKSYAGALELLRPLEERLYAKRCEWAMDSLSS